MLIQEIPTHIYRKEGKQGHFMLKIDLVKAFDRLEWSFVYRVDHQTHYELR